MKPETTTLSSQPVPLTDTQVRRFLTDGYLILNANVPSSVHQTIYQKLDRILHGEGNPGNNILPAIPEFQAILDSPTVRGALTAVLGPNYALHPHRYVHNNEPGKRTAEGEKMGEGSHSFIGWHQDDHSPLARTRHHYSRYAMVLYYPQDTPKSLGPTQIIPATHRHRRLSPDDYARGFQAEGPAGTCVMLHFDLAHGGSLNIGDHTRYMAKFVFVRTEEPAEPAWDNQETDWKTPEDHLAPAEMPAVWAHHWEWLSGRAGQRRLRASSADVDALVEALESPEETIRQNAIYTLAAIGESAVRPLIADLSCRQESRWNESAIVMEGAAYALAALGKPAVGALLPLLDHASEWVQINALFALGEMGTEACEAIPAMVAKLNSPVHGVVRTALDALGQIGATEAEALSSLRRLLLESHSDWQAPIMRGWSAQDQVRANAMTALLRSGWKSPETTELIAACLHDPCGYVTGLGVESLIRQGTPAALQAALHSLLTHRWDETLYKGFRTF